MPVTTGTLMMMTLAGRFWDHVTRVTCQGNQDSPLAYCLHEQSPVGPNENEESKHSKVQSPEHYVHGNHIEVLLQLELYLQSTA